MAGTEAAPFPVRLPCSPRRTRRQTASPPLELAKVQRLNARAQQLGTNAVPLNIAVNFDIEGKNPHGVEQHRCIDCGDRVTGCNVGANNTLYLNYLPMAANAGAQVFTQAKVEWIEKQGTGWRIHGVHYTSAQNSERRKDRVKILYWPSPR